MGTGERGLWGDGPALTGSGLVMEGILLLPREKNQLWGQCKGMQNAGLHESTGVQELWRRRPAPQRAKGWGGPAVKGVVELAETDHPGNGGAGGGGGSVCLGKMAGRVSAGVSSAPAALRCRPI